MPEINRSAFIAALGTSISSALTTTATLPSTIQPVEIFKSVYDAYLAGQTTYNTSVSAGGEAINVASPYVEGGLIFDANGNPVQQILGSARFERQFVEGTIEAAVTVI